MYCRSSLQVKEEDENAYEGYVEGYGGEDQNGYLQEGQGVNGWTHGDLAHGPGTIWTILNNSETYGMTFVVSSNLFPFMEWILVKFISDVVIFKNNIIGLKYWSPSSYRTPAVIGRRRIVWRFSTHARIPSISLGEGHRSKSQNTKK